LIIALPTRRAAYAETMSNRADGVIGWLEASLQTMRGHRSEPEKSQQNLRSSRLGAIVNFFTLLSSKASDLAFRLEYFRFKCYFYRVIVIKDGCSWSQV